MAIFLLTYSNQSQLLTIVVGDDQVNTLINFFHILESVDTTHLYTVLVVDDISIYRPDTSIHSLRMGNIDISILFFQVSKSIDSFIAHKWLLQQILPDHTFCSDIFIFVLFSVQAENGTHNYTQLSILGDRHVCKRNLTFVLQSINCVSLN